ncbi:AAA family ATPase [soil metagenome]
MHTHDDTDVPDLRIPTSPEAVGLSPALMEDILLRRSVIEGRTPMTTLADKLHVSINVIDSLLGSMRERKLIEYDGMEGRAYRVATTEAGRELSAQRSRETRYAGPMPVPLELYTAVVRHQRPTVRLNQEMLARSFSDLVISPTLLDQLGPAIHGEGAMFLYGPPGTGKSSVAERVVRAYQDTVLIPHCLEVDGQIISVFDPTLHEPIDEQPVGLDRRWVVCRRPAVVTGGELHAGMLDLQLDRDTGVYLAPLQMKANSGVLVIDDFGRQAMTPDALLNRWIVPLDRQVDYLTLHGRKFEVPFEVKVVLSTNLPPSALGDEAFFRRIHNKIFIGACTDEQFDWILARVCQKKGLDVDGAAAARLRGAARAQGDGELRAYLPGVVCELALAITAYEDGARQLTPQLVDRVLDLYFARMEGAPSMSTAATEPAPSEPAPSETSPLAAAPIDARQLLSDPGTLSGDDVSPRPPEFVPSSVRAHPDGATVS